MALQGTLETFSLSDVLALLSATKKTGCLRISGDRGDGALWVADGSLVSSEASGAANAQGPVDVVFELLRFDEGEFVFDEGQAPDSAGDPADVATVLGDAGTLLDEWQEIAAVVPSADHWVALRPELDADEVTISRERWAALVAVAGGVSVDGFAQRLGHDELPAGRLIKDLAAEGLIEVGEPRPDEAAPAPADASPSPEPPPTLVDDADDADDEPAAVDDEPATVADEPAAVADDEQPPSDEPAPEPFGEQGFEPFDPDGLVIDPDAPLAAPPPPMLVDRDEEPGVDLEADEAVAEPAAPAEAEPGEAAEIARQLANLSPKAARAVAAAAKASTPEERDAALAEVEASDEQINRDLLLKFLGSVN